MNLKMDLFTVEDFEKLSRVKGADCVSIYIPTHESGIEVNEGLDKLAFKNEVAKLKELFISGKKDPATLQPLFDLVEDDAFWKEQFNGLAVFLYQGYVWKFRTPISFNLFSMSAEFFMLSPLAPLLSDNGFYYVLALSRNGVRLFKSTKFTIEEINIKEIVPENMGEVMSAYVIGKEVQGKKNYDQSNSGHIHFYGHGNADNNDDKYLFEYFRQIDKGLEKILKKDGAPLILTGTDYLLPIYQNANTYKNFVDKGIPGNPDRLSEKEIHEKSLSIMKDILERPKRKSFEKFRALAGTGKTSNDLKVIVQAAAQGRIESLFLTKDQHIWAKFDEKNNVIEVHSERRQGDICLLNYAITNTIEDNGDVYNFKSEQAPEENAAIAAFAVFRY
jgi:hypothetical protein